MIIWDEYLYGQYIYNNGIVNTKKWQYKELKCLIKYMLKNNHIPKEIRSKLYDCCQDNLKYLRDRQRTALFNKLIQQVKKEEILTDKTIVIYKSEIEVIKAINDVNLEKIVFILLVYCKWLNNIKWFSLLKSDIAYEAKIQNINSNNQQIMISRLCELGIINSSVVKLNKRMRKRDKDIKKQMWCVPFLAIDGDVAFEFDNYTNVVFRYLNYVYGGYFECDNCRGIYKRNSNRQTYCKFCKDNVVKEQTIQRVKKHRNIV